MKEDDTMNERIKGPGRFSDKGLDNLTTCIQADIDKGLIPGASMLIAHNGKTVYESALGLQDPATRVPMSRESIFRIYSMTKPVVSVGVMMLVEQGRLLLSDPISKFLPELQDLKVGVEVIADGVPHLRLEPALQPITVQDLLRHTSGFTYGIFGDSLVKAEYRRAGIAHPRMSSDEFIKAMGQVPLMYQPGTVWEYSHSTDVLGVLLERVSGQSLDEFLSERIFKPLGMLDTGFWVEEEHHHRIAEGFDVDPVTGVTVRMNQPRRRPNLLGGGGGLMSTMQDYLHFAQMLANGGECENARIISRKTLQWMTSDHLAGMPHARSGQGYLPGPGYGFGLGFAVRTEPGSAFIPGSVGDFTWSGLAGTYFWIDPEEQLLAIFLMQAPEQRNHYRQLFRNLVYAALE
ncbi:serine hydrolase domain-containing protein [Noviherbaspirillum aerium]|uniref:serine hydrolase domain-containing protein n=1 Tax=Noviherbaspirillum aerium TaxID=2588497 RepID=UPI001CEF782A|nr:serine hydrolase domain-containing protein [Noviherbaspirillum aerium]